jgi:hypothetical protein
MRYGYKAVFNRLAAEPFFVFLAIFMEVLETHAGCSTNWTLGNPVFVEDEKRTGYPTTAASFTERAVVFAGVNIVVGLLVKGYFTVHAEAKQELDKIENSSSKKD